MTFKNENCDRLLVTYDAGRPYEIDTESLEVLTPVGSKKEWQAEIEKPNYPFNPILSTAHPTFDTYTQEVFTVNYGRSLENFIATIPDLQKLPLEVRDFLTKVGGMKDFVYLIRWDGANPLERWKVINPDGTPVIIKQSMHQIGISKDYVVLMDTAFTAGFEQILNNPFPHHQDLERILATLLERPASFNTTLYIVRRVDLIQGQRPAESDTEVTVVAQKVTLPLEACHFLVDYENPDDKITLHVAHICAWDVAEWLRSYDRSPYQDSTVPSRLYGTQQGEMDISRMGRYVIDGKTLGTNPNIESRVLSHPTCTWGPGLFAYMERLPSGMTPGKLDNIYWVSFGLWKDLMTEFMYKLYENYDYQGVLPRQKVLDLAAEGKPACLYRVNTESNESMAIADWYECPESHMILSPQFVPRGDGNSTNGYLVCTVFTPENSEIWIFDGQNLKQGPLCKLSHPQFDIGLSLHTAWLPNLSPRQANYHVSVEYDYQDLVENLPHAPEIKEEIENLFAQSVYPHFAERLKST